MTPRTRFRLVSLVCLASAALVPPSLVAQNFVYVNDNIAFPGPNAVSAFSVSLSGGAFTFTPISGSPFSTGGNGILGFAAVNEIALSSGGHFLFAANAGSNDITVFPIDKDTGALMTPVGTFGTGGNDCFGMSLAEAVTNGGKFLYAANSCSGDISVFSVASDGTLTPTSFSPVALGVAARPDGIAVRPNGMFLAVALPVKSDGFTILNKVAVYSIGPGGELTAVPGSPFLATGSGLETGVSFKCGSKILFGAEANANETIVDVYDVDSNGVLSTISGDPFTFGFGTAKNSNVVLSSPPGDLPVR